MAWYWWLLIAVALFGIIGAICSGDSYEEEESTSDAMNRLAALVIIDGLKYERPEVWAKCASEIMGRQIDPPTPEQVARWKAQRAEREARKDTGTTL